MSVRLGSCRVVVRSVLLLAAFQLLFFGAEAFARSFLWEEITYAYYAEDEPIRDLLGQFASAVNVPIVISENVNGVVNGDFESAPAREFIDRLSKIHSLLWYYDGQALYVYGSDEVSSNLIHLGGVPSGRLMAVLAGLEVLDRRYPLTIIGDEGIVMVSGPPRYTELVSEVIAILQSSQVGKAEGGDGFVVRAFDLKYAWAGDRSVVINGRQVRLPGVASIIQSLLGQQRSNQFAPVIEANTVPKLKGQGLIKKERSASLAENQGDTDDQRSGEEGELGSVGGEPAGTVIANDRLNAVIVHDRASRMGMYRRLIESLDVPSDQVEIEVSIMDVSTERLNEMGVEWQINSESGSFTNSDLSGGGLPRETNELSFAFGDRGSFSTLLTNSQDLFFTRIRALTEQGDASVLSQPTVLTLDNVEAVVDHSTTFFVRLVGENEVDLFPVSVGSIVRVTPRIVNETGGQQRVHLNVNIEDGQQTGQEVDDIPVITKSVINTEAVVNDKGSLLVGGYYYNQDSTNSRKIPLLGDLPLIGHFFRTDGSSAQKRARLFLISPRVIASGGAEDDYAGQIRSLFGGDQSLIQRTRELGDVVRPGAGSSYKRGRVN